MEYQMGGTFQAECYNPDGSLAWKDIAKNGITNAGLNDNISVYLCNGTKKSTWYLGLINNAGFGTLSANDTMSSHAGWTETTAYSEGVRQTWTPGSVAGQAVTNPTPASFTANASISVAGLFLVSDNTAGGTAGVLWATGQFDSGAQSLTSGQVLKVTYSLSAASS